MVPRPPRFLSAPELLYFSDCIPIDLVVRDLPLHVAAGATLFVSLMVSIERLAVAVPNVKRQRNSSTPQPTSVAEKRRREPHSMGETPRRILSNSPPRKGLRDFLTLRLRARCLLLNQISLFFNGTCRTRCDDLIRWYLRTSARQLTQLLHPR
jgi:hypothetical protein